jgi:hypothetical protein
LIRNTKQFYLAVILWTHVRKKLVLNLNWYMGYSWIFIVLCSASRKTPGYNYNFLPKPFQFTIYPSSYLLVLYGLNIDSTIK